jgi:hypothetical protein
VEPEIAANARLCAVNQAAYLVRVTSTSRTPTKVTVRSSQGRLSTLQRSTNLTPNPVWRPVPSQTDIRGAGGGLSLSDAGPSAPAFYRVSVRFP